MSGLSVHDTPASFTQRNVFLALWLEGGAHSITPTCQLLATGSRRYFPSIISGESIRKISAEEDGEVFGLWLEPFRGDTCGGVAFRLEVKAGVPRSMSQISARAFFSGSFP